MTRSPIANMFREGADQTRNRRWHRTLARRVRDAVRDLAEEHPTLRPELSTGLRFALWPEEDE